MDSVSAPTSRDSTKSHARPTPAAKCELLAEISRLVSYRHHLPETFDGLLQHLRRSLDVDMLTLAHPDESRNLMQLRYWCSNDLTQADLPPELPPKDCPSGLAWSTQEIVTANDVANERRWPTLASQLRSAGIETYCFVPLTAGDRRIGALGLGRRKRHAFSDDELQLLRLVAIPVAMAVENELICEHASRRDASRDALRRGEAYLAEAQKLSHTGSWTLDVASDKYVYISDECLRIYGFDPQEGLPTREVVFRRIHPEDSDRVRVRFDKSLREKVDSSDELRIVLPDGTVKHIHVIRHPVLNSAGDVVQLIGTSIDITERKRAEDELWTSKTQLAQERDRLSLLLEINNHIVSKLDVDELFQAVAASMRRYFGSDLTSFWLFNQQSGCLERKFLHSPTGQGFLAKMNVSAAPSILESKWFRLRQPQICSADLAELPPAIRDACRAESIVSAVLVPLVGADGPLGLLAMSSRKENTFNETERDLLSEIGTQISLVLDNALAHERLRAQRDNLEDQRLYLESEIGSQYNFEDIVGNCSVIKKVLQQVAVVSPTDSTVLLHGETGTGKELIARAIHNLSARRDRTFVRMNCAAIPSGLLESELFGHEKGAFTGALMQRRGRFELADHGSLFLDEIGDISLELQPKLLRAVQEQEFERLGSARTIHVNVRIIAATHRDLPTMIREGKFREDLFYRLNVFPIQIPPLRERREDIPLLVNHFVTKLSRQMGKRITSIPRETMEVLRNCAWPGNVRELANFIERAVILSQGSTLNVPLGELKWRGGTMPSHENVQTLVASEREIILRAIREANGVVAAAAGKLGIKRTTLNSKMRKLQISRSDLFFN